MTNKTGSLTPQQQEQYLSILSNRLEPSVRAAALEVAEWLATEVPPGQEVTPAQVLEWVRDVQARREVRTAHPSAVVYQFRRKQ